MYICIYRGAEIPVPPHTLIERCQTSDPYRGAGEACDFMDCYAEGVGTCLLMLQDIL